jgi:hypothetical protein
MCSFVAKTPCRLATKDHQPSHELRLAGKELKEDFPVIYVWLMSLRSVLLWLKLRADWPRRITSLRTSLRLAGKELKELLCDLCDLLWQNIRSFWQATKEHRELKGKHLGNGRELALRIRRVFLFGREDPVKIRARSAEPVPARRTPSRAANSGISRGFSDDAPSRIRGSRNWNGRRRCAPFPGQNTGFDRLAIPVIESPACPKERFLPPQGPGRSDGEPRLHEIA